MVHDGAPACRVSGHDTEIDTAVRLLRAGRLVAFPTETVYGLGADASAPEAVAQIFSVKGRPYFNPLIAHVASLEGALAEGIFSPEAQRLAARFWPGPLTLVVPRAESGRVCDLACAGLATVGLRVPSHPIALALLDGFGGPIVAPSANRSGRLSPTTSTDVACDLGGAVDLILDGGSCPVGIESTIIGMSESDAVLLRPGGIDREIIEATLGGTLQTTPTGIAAPGMLASHYAPNAALRLDADRLAPGEVGLDFGSRLPGAALDLSPGGNLAEAAANLYRYLRQLDAAAPPCIAVASLPERGLGAAINDRLRRAAAPRPT